MLITLELNTSPQPVNETIEVGGVDVPIVLPAGSFIRVLVEGARISIAGADELVIKGSFGFDQSTKPSGAKVTRIAMTGVELTYQGQGLRDGQGVFVLAGTGVAGFMSGKANVAAGGVSAGGSFGRRDLRDRRPDAHRQVPAKPRQPGYRPARHPVLRQPQPQHQ
jgi:hypothetical protein